MPQTGFGGAPLPRRLAVVLGRAMKGVIFQIVEEVVTAAHGESAWDDLLTRAGLDGVYTSLGLYEDDELTRLVAAGSEALGTPPRELLRQIGRHAIPSMFRRWPDYFASHTSIVPLLWSLNGVIHAEVRKLYSGTLCPHFDIVTKHHDELLLSYDSPRHLCDLAHGFIVGTADHYRETVTVSHLKCMHDGDAKCVMTVRQE